jgi:hypothetical protein
MVGDGLHFVSRQDNNKVRSLADKSYIPIA